MCTVSVLTYLIYTHFDFLNVLISVNNVLITYLIYTQFDFLNVLISVTVLVCTSISINNYVCLYVCLYRDVFHCGTSMCGPNVPVVSGRHAHQAKQQRDVSGNAVVIRSSVVG